MKYIKKSERFMKVSAFYKPFKDEGAVIKEVAEYSKWKQIDEDSKIQVSFTIISITFNGKTSYILKDFQGMMASYPNDNLYEIMDWLKNRGFKTIHDWYITECGMSEETWKEWNAGND